MPATAERLATASWRALGTSVVLRVTSGAALADARAVLEDELDAIDRACSRFRADSELERINAAGGRFVATSPLFAQALSAALRGARLSEGAVDPTLGEAIIRAGYSCDWEQLGSASTAPADPAPAIAIHRAPAWELIELRVDPPGARIPAGIRLDLGAVAKALAADRAAAAAAAATAVGVLVSLGGDIAVAGPAPADGWAIRVTDDHRSAPAAPGQTVTIREGGLATSSTTVRRWRKDDREMHHILHPASGEPVAGPWRTASVAAASCVDANIASTAALVKGVAAPRWLAERHLPARLVSRGGAVRRVGAWPREAR